MTACADGYDMSANRCGPLATALIASIPNALAGDAAAALPWASRTSTTC